MNKAGYKNDTGLFKETKLFMNHVESSVNNLTEKEENIVFLKDAWIPNRADIRKSISFGGFPEEFRSYITKLWNEISDYQK